MTESGAGPMEWARSGTALFLSTVDNLQDEQLHAPSSLPGWSRAWVVAHVACNARALSNLVTWASTGVESPMYPDAGARIRDIEAAASLPPDELRARLRDEATSLISAMGTMDVETSAAMVRSALGRAIPAAEIPWLRAREVWVHCVDLDAGVTLDRFPAHFALALLDEAAAAVGAKPGCPAVRLVSADSGKSWHLGGSEDVTEISGSVAELLGYVIGRTQRADAPALPAWI